MEADDSAIKVPSDSRRQPLESNGVKRITQIPVYAVPLARLHVGSPEARIVGIQDVHVDLLRCATGELNVNLPPILELRSAEDKHGGYEVNPVFIDSEGSKR